MSILVRTLLALEIDSTNRCREGPELRPKDHVGLSIVHSTGGREIAHVIMARPSETFTALPCVNVGGMREGNGPGLSRSVGDPIHMLTFLGVFHKRSKMSKYALFFSKKRKKKFF